MVRLKNGKVFYDFSFTEDEEALDGMKVDKEGNLFVSAPGGLWILNKEGKLLGKIVTPERPANMAWGDEDGKTLYMTAHTSLYKVRVNTGSRKPGLNPDLLPGRRPSNTAHAYRRPR